MKLLACKDVGFDCDYTAIAETTAAVLRNIGEHAITYHGMMEITIAHTNEWRAKIHDESIHECSSCESE